MRGRKALLIVTLVALLGATLMTPLSLVRADRMTDPKNVFGETPTPQPEPTPTVFVPPGFTPAPQDVFGKTYPLTWAVLQKAGVLGIFAWLLTSDIKMAGPRPVAPAPTPSVLEHLQEGPRGESGNRERMADETRNKEDDDCLCREAGWYDDGWHDNATVLVFINPDFKSGNRKGGMQFLHNRAKPDRSTFLGGTDPPKFFHCPTETQTHWCEEAREYLRKEILPNIPAK